MDLLPYITSLPGIIVGGLGIWYGRRERKARVVAEEATTADKMVDLVRKSFELAIENMKADFERRTQTLTDDNEERKKTNEKICKRLSALEKAIRNINICAHRANCPILAELPDTILGE